jgi:hypothetical protein
LAHGSDVVACDLASLLSMMSNSGSTSGTSPIGVMLPLMRTWSAPRIVTGSLGLMPAIDM